MRPRTWRILIMIKKCNRDNAKWDKKTDWRVVHNSRWDYKESVSYHPQGDFNSYLTRGEKETKGRGKERKEKTNFLSISGWYRVKRVITRATTFSLRSSTFKLNANFLWQWAPLTSRNISQKVLILQITRDYNNFSSRTPSPPFIQLILVR